MGSITLTAQELGRWLAKRGVEVKASFWETVNRGCSAQLISEQLLVVNQVPWRGLAYLRISFVQGAKLHASGWLEDRRCCQGAELYVVAIEIDAVIACSSRLHRPSNRLTPHLGETEFGISIEYPSVQDIDSAWQTLSSIAPNAYSSLEAMSHEFEQAVGAYCAA